MNIKNQIKRTRQNPKIRLVMIKYISTIILCVCAFGCTASKKSSLIVIEKHFSKSNLEYKNDTMDYAVSFDLVNFEKGEEISQHINSKSTSFKVKGTNINYITKVVFDANDNRTPATFIAKGLSISFDLDKRFNVLVFKEITKDRVVVEYSYVKNNHVIFY